MGVVDRIRTLCEENGITINKLEKEAEVGRGNVARWDKHRPNIDKVQRVADYFGVSSDYILTGSKNKPVPISESELTPYMIEAIELFKSTNEEQQKKLLELVRNGRNLMGDSKNG